MVDNREQTFGTSPVHRIWRVPHPRWERNVTQQVWWSEILCDSTGVVEPDPAKTSFQSFRQQVGADAVDQDQYRYRRRKPMYSLLQSAARQVGLRVMKARTPFTRTGMWSLGREKAVSRWEARRNDGLESLDHIKS